MLVRLKVDPERHVERLGREDLPERWNAFPHPEVTRQLGMRWLERGRSAVLEVPSAVVLVSKNYLVNPLHPDLGELERSVPQPFRWDAQLFRRPPEDR